MLRCTSFQVIEPCNKSRAVEEKVLEEHVGGVDKAEAIINLTLV